MVNKRENETSFEYIVRLFQNKALYDLDYQELFKLAFGVELASDECRKRFYGISMLLNEYETQLANSIKDSSEEELLSILAQKEFDVQVQKQKVLDLRRDVNRIKRESARKELVLEEYKTAVLDSILQPPVIEVPKFTESLQNEKVHILCFGDIHYGKKFKSLTNVYSMDVVNERFCKLFNSTVEYIEENKVERMIVCNVGDTIQGMLRASDLKQLQIGAVQQTIQVMRFLASWLNDLSAYVEIDYYQTKSSNHGQTRPLGTSRNELIEEDLEIIVGEYLKDILAHNKRVNFKESLTDNIVTFNELGFNFGLIHGSEFRPSSNILATLSSKYNLLFDYMIVGHLHHSSSTVVGEGKHHNKEVLHVGSIMGTDTYADGLLVGAKPSATIYQFVAEKGKRVQTEIIL